MVNKFDRFVYYCSGVVNYDIKTHEDSYDLLSSFVSFCESYNRISKFYLIFHDDTNVPHIHFVFYLSSQTRILTIFNKMRDWFVNKKHDTRNEEGINLDKCASINAYLRYMLHVDDASKRENKKVFSLDDIVSNDDVNIIESLINSKKGEIDAYYLRDCVLDCLDDFELMNKLGLKVFHRYRYEIDILKQNRASLVLMRAKEREEKKSALDEVLPF